MKRLGIALAAAASLTLLSACATATPYQAASLTSGSYHPGYTDTRIEDDRYRIGFSGNDLTSRETVENYMLYHAAELTLKAGYDWFEVIKRDTDQKTRTVSTPDDPLWGNMSWRFYGRSRWSGWGMGFDDWDSVQYTRYEANAEILMHKGAKPDGDPAAYDAHAVKANLERQIVRPVPK
ncbi:hypothetical protein [Asticcacaulis sp. EMRT-3]|uniref:CC0125/CC1285 family lipoprotein n=1 Tax=Asticcacaulis sp. EMRT-3 TaxID=3040349 RepID=UPI0024AFA6B4|nr:hypothetical protein [Asticcacaulis sp. EMRT-3]MDI7775789.1 hypothetical protein [Asticcacaulis sp. EMRT-3]